MDKQTDKYLPAIPSLKQASSSDFYANQLADLVEAQGLLTAPANLKSSILERSKQMDVLLIAKSNHLYKKLELFYYGLKVSIAAACCVGVILAAPKMYTEYFLPHSSSGFLPIYEKVYKKVLEWNEKADNFSRQLWEMEVSSYDKQEK